MIGATGALRLGRGLLLLFGAGFALLGLRYFLDPAALTAESGVAIPSVKAVMEIRTVYGGLFTGLGLAVTVLGLKRATIPAGLTALILTAGTVALARIAAIALGETPDALFATLLAIEIVGVTLAAFALRSLSRS